MQRGTGDLGKVQDQFLEQAAYKAFTHPASIYRPYKPNKAWIELVGSHTDDKPRVKVLSAANKTGKTMTTVMILEELIWGPSSQHFDFGLFKKWPYPRNVWIDSEDSTLREVMIPMMHEFFPKGKYKIDKAGKTFEYHWKCEGKDGLWNIYIKTYDTDPQKLESSLLGLCIFSEPPPYEHYKALPARMPKGGLVLLEMTPIVKAGGRSLAWVYDELWEDGKCEIMYSDIEDVCIECNDGFGLWKHQYVKELIEGYDPDEREARAHGVYQKLSGLVYKELDENLHLVPKFEIPKSWQVAQIIDPHDRKPPAACWIAINPKGEGYVIDEYPRFKKGRGYETLTDDKYLIDEHVQRFLNIEKMNGWDVRWRIMDPRFGNKIYRNTMRTVKQEFDQGLRKHGNTSSYTLGDTSDLDPGHKRVKELLLHKEGDIVVPKLFIMDNNMNTWRFMSRYDFISEKPSDKKDIPIQVNMKYKDFCDLIRYYALANLKFEYGRLPQAEVPWRERIKKRNRFGGIDWRIN